MRCIKTLPEAACGATAPSLAEVSLEGTEPLESLSSLSYAGICRVQNLWSFGQEKCLEDKVGSRNPESLVTFFIVFNPLSFPVMLLLRSLI